MKSHAEIYDFSGGRSVLRRRRYAPIQIDTKSPSYVRMTAAGFSFEVGELGVLFAGTMTCVCGRKEAFSVARELAVNGKIDIAGIAEASGAASVRHLRLDGYSVDEIKAIRKAFL